jgi:hypothetical protein
MPRREWATVRCTTLTVSLTGDKPPYTNQCKRRYWTYVQKLTLALGNSKPKFSTGRSVTILRVPTPNLLSNVTDRPSPSFRLLPTE